MGYTARMRANQWHRGILIGALLLVSFWLGSSIWGLFGKMRIAMGEAHDVQQQYEALEARKASLQANLAVLDTKRGQDAAIRTSFGVARPGEEVIVVVPPASTTAVTTLSWWQRILSWFW